MGWRKKVKQVRSVLEIARELAATAKIWAETDNMPKEVLASISAIDQNLKTAVETAGKLIDFNDH